MAMATPVWVALTSTTSTGMLRVAACAEVRALVSGVNGDIAPPWSKGHPLKNGARKSSVRVKGMSDMLLGWVALDGTDEGSKELGNDNGRQGTSRFMLVECPSQQLWRPGSLRALLEQSSDRVWRGWETRFSRRHPKHGHGGGNSGPVDQHREVSWSWHATMQIHPNKNSQMPVCHCEAWPASKKSCSWCHQF